MTNDEQMEYRNIPGCVDLQLNSRGQEILHGMEDLCRRYP